ncbi:MAG: 3-isopropylmalate dehydrogenase, partial [Campylobacteraceae bacterium]|nr:3-isopropylmalate dehydrogenase [Campylobacteraceae bacterium]
MSSYKICVLKGDGIGPEIVDEAIKVLDVVADKHNFSLNYEQLLIGGEAYDTLGDPLPAETLEEALNSDAVLLGAIGGPKWDELEDRSKRPESGLLRLRKGLGAFANLRPAIVFDELVDASTIKPDILKGVDILVVRELTGGLYFGEPRKKEENRAFNTMIYTVEEIERIAKVAFEAALKRHKKVTLVDKANVLETSQLWREVVTKMAKKYEDVRLDFMYVDNAAMQLIRDPKQFDVLLTENLFGDILSDEASMICGSIGLLPSASIGG